METNINTTLLAIAGHWDLRLNGLSAAHAVVARNGNPEEVERFEDAIENYLVGVSEKRFYDILDADPEEKWEAMMGEDISTQGPWAENVESFGELSSAIIAHIWFEYRLMGNESIWAEYLDVVEYFSQAEVAA